jgi:hypothetical protein
MAEESSAKVAETKTMAINVRLKPGEHVGRPILANYINIEIAEGIAYINCGFIEPATLLEMAKRSQNVQTGSKQIEGSLTTRVALPLDTLFRLHRQLSHVLSGIGRTASVS